MRRGFIAFCVVLGFAGIPADAAPTDDPQGWIERFGQAVLSANVDTVTNTVTAISDPRLNPEALRSAITTGLKAVGTQSPEYVEKFDREDLGHFAIRVSFAVRYTSDFLYYRVVLERDIKGWQLIQINIDGSLEKILRAPWPS